MYRYAQIDPVTGRCFAISEFEVDMEGAGIILLGPDDDVQLNDIYGGETWTRPEPPVVLPPGPSVIDILGQQMVQKDLQILDLQQKNAALGGSLVSLELRLLALEGGGQP